MTTRSTLQKNLVLLIIGFTAGIVACSDDNGNGEKTPPAIEGFEWISAGSFMMGSPEDEPEAQGEREWPQHKVTLTKGFYMSKYQVTQALYESVIGTNPSYFTEVNDYCENPRQRPVDRVAWYDAIEFCNKLSDRDGLDRVYTITNITPDPETGFIADATVVADWSKNGYRLPTEAEFEYAMRAGTTTPFNTGWNITTDQANYNGLAPYNGNPQGIYRQTTIAVGSFAPNAWGLYDTHGNIWEWTWDRYSEYTVGPKVDPRGPDTGATRVVRGGSWDSFGGVINVRSAYRVYPSPDNRTLNRFGFRIARNQ